MSVKNTKKKNSQVTLSKEKKITPKQNIKKIEQYIPIRKMILRIRIINESLVTIRKIQILRISIT